MIAWFPAQTPHRPYLSVETLDITFQFMFVKLLICTVFLITQIKSWPGGHGSDTLTLRLSETVQMHLSWLLKNRMLPTQVSVDTVRTCTAKCFFKRPKQSENGWVWPKLQNMYVRTIFCYSKAPRARPHNRPKTPNPQNQANHKTPVTDTQPEAFKHHDCGSLKIKAENKIKIC